MGRSIKHVAGATSVLVGVLTMVGCGAPEPDTAIEDGASATQSPVYADDAYGMDGSGNRCWTPSGWAGGYCDLPKKKTWKVRIPTSTNNFGCGTDSVAAILTAVQEWEYQLNVRAGHGWNVSHTTSANADFTINCSINYNPGTYGKTTISHNPPIIGGSYVCDGNSPWEACRYGAISSMIIWPNQICPPLSCTMNATQRRTVTTNVVLHELFHVAGLGHDTCAETPLMSPNYCAGTKYIATPTDFEIGMLQHYNPGSGTTPL